MRPWSREALKHAAPLALPPISVRRGRGPLAAQVAAGLRKAIAEGALACGSRLPSSRVLARRLRVSRNTVLAAYELLEWEGLIVGRVGSGTRVSSPAGDLLRLPRAVASGHVLRLRESGFPFDCRVIVDPDGHPLYFHR